MTFSLPWENRSATTDVPNPNPQRDLSQAPSAIRKLIGATGLTPQRLRERPLTCCIDYTLGACALSPEFTPESVPGWLMGTNKADDEDSCLGQAKLRMVKDQAWPIIRGLRC